MQIVDFKSIDKKVLNSKGTKLVLFFAEWCPYCSEFRPIFESYAKKSNIPFFGARINDDEDPLWDRFGFETVPTLIAFTEGKEVARKSGVRSVGLDEEDLKEILSSLGS